MLALFFFFPEWGHVTQQIPLLFLWSFAWRWYCQMFWEMHFEEKQAILTYKRVDLRKSDGAADFGFPKTLRQFLKSWFLAIFSWSKSKIDSKWQYDYLSQPDEIYISVGSVHFSS